MIGQHELHISAGLRYVPLCQFAEKKAQRLNSGTASNRLHFTNGTDAMIAQGCQYCMQTGQKYIYMSELSSITKMCPASQQYVTLFGAWSRKN